MSYGSIKPFVSTLAESLTAAGVTVQFGEEYQEDESANPPLVVIVPVGGPFKPGQGYMKNPPPNVSRVWMVQDQIQVWCWGLDESEGATNIDHIDATETLGAYVLQALDAQRPSGLMYQPVNRRWLTDDKSFARLGRALVLTFQADISIPGITPPTVLVSSTEIDAEVEA